MAVTEQVLLGKVENQQYILETGNLQGHVARLGYQGGVLDDENSTHHKTALKITYDKEYPLKHCALHGLGCELLHMNR